MMQNQVSLVDKQAGIQSPCQIQMTAQQVMFLNEFAKGLAQDIYTHQKTKEVQSNHLNDIDAYINGLSKGYACISGSDAHCRPVAVTVQGAMEKRLAELLCSGEIHKVSARFLTPEPATPFRKNGHTLGLSVNFNESQQYTLDLREHTVRALRDQGAWIHVAYSASKYQKLKEANDMQGQVEIFEKEKKHPQIIVYSLSQDIPAELVGAVYEFFDKNNEQWIIATQGIQAKDASPGEWKMWMEPAAFQGPGLNRIFNVKNFIDHNA